jgi:pyruvate dehydrogenase E2 component (dihydrolipoamide acetyltransferase)
MPAKASEERLTPLTRMRRAIIKSMTASAAVPQFTIEFEAGLSPLAAIKAQLAEARVNLSYTDVLIAACARGLRAHRRLNASLTDEGIVEHAHINVGLAISVPDGLIAPAIIDADQRSISDIAAERERLSAAAAAGTLKPEDVLNTTFTISNLGPLGVLRFRALVIPPQTAILAAGTLTSRQQISLSLSCDHRVIDGMPAALFLRDVVTYLEQPEWVMAVLDQAPTGASTNPR